ncbi:MAG: hypothetical protein WA240_12460 [Nitrospirota bacterium]
MGYLSNITVNDWIAIYGALLSTIIAVVASFRFIARRIRARRERAKFQTDMYFLQKIDRNTKEVHPIVVVLLANLGSERIALKSLDYQGIAENGLETTGCMGWYEQPEELFGIRNRLLPLVLESGKTADLPMVEIGVLTRIKNLKIWLTDFDGRRHYLAENDIANVRNDVEKFLLERKA